MRHTRRKYTFPTVLALALTGAAWAVDQDTLEWFESDFETRALAVNEGELAFLSSPPAEPVHHHANRIRITETSLETGWITLDQCHYHLDAVPNAQIAYRPEKVQDLEIVSSRNIHRAWVEGHTIQLRDVAPGAEICIRAQSRALTDLGDGLFSLQNGPFMRRFLDGYYPMRVSMTVGLQDAPLRVVRVTPLEQEGFRVWQDAKGLHYDAWFEGKLYTEVVFEQTGT